MADEQMKAYSLSLAIKGTQAKTAWEIPTPLSEQLRYNVSVQHQMLERNGAAGLLTHCLEEYKNGRAILESSVAVPYQIKSAYTIRSSRCTRGHLFQKCEKLGSHRSPSRNVYSNFICNIPKPETSHMSFSGWVVAQTVAFPYHGILVGNKKEQTLCRYELCWIPSKWRRVKNSVLKVTNHMMPLR